MRVAMALVAASLILATVSCGPAGSGGSGAPAASPAAATPAVTPGVTTKPVPLPSGTPGDMDYGY